MHIDELNSKTNFKNVTVTLSYKEIRDISNGLYCATESSEEAGKKFKDIYNKSKILFDLVKHGNIQDETIKKLADK